MKKIATFLLIVISLNSCKKEETKNTSTSGSDLTNCKITRYYDVNNETKITYNSSGKVSKIEEFEENVLTNTFTYTYELGKASYVNSTGREKGEYILDSKGRATGSSITYYQGQDPTTATSGEFTYYKYNSDGNLIERKTEYLSQSGTTTYTTTYLWTNGNLTKEIEVSSSNTTNITEYEYYTDKVNSLGATDAILEFTGVQSKNLQKDGETGETIVSFTYEFNSSGKPTKIIFDEDGELGVINLEMICP